MSAIAPEQLRIGMQQFISAELLDGAPIESGDELLISGQVDSLGVMRLVTFVEQQANVAIPVEEITIENFSSIDVIVEYLTRRFG
ncbi:MAG: acyl carrier protein [Pseudomonadota bacterium]